ncbi:MAG: hypothetical protein ACLP7W_07275, partial [Solirubrobacteraceae bacterium]
MIDVAETTVKLFASTVPNFTSFAPVKFVPVIVTFVPPANGPSTGSTFDTDGATAPYPNSSALFVALSPPTVVTVTL